VASSVDISQIALRQLEFLVALADEGSYVGAAQRLGVAVPNLWKQLRRLEDILGVKLTEPQRRGASPRLTKVGQEVVEEARRLLAHSSGLLAAVQRTLDEGGPPFRTAGFPAHCSLMLSELSAQLEERGVHAEVPEANEDSRVDAGRRLLDAVARGDLDLVVAPAHDGHDSVVLTAEPFYQWSLVAVLEGHPKRKVAGDALALTDLADTPLVVSPQHHVSNTRLTEAANKAGVALDIRATTDSVEAMLAHGRAGLAVPVVPADALASFPHTERVVPLVDHHGDEVCESHYLYYRKADDKDERLQSAVQLAWRIAGKRDLRGVHVLSRGRYPGSRAG